MMAFLKKSLPEHPRMQNQIGINAGQIVKIGFYLTGYRINGFIRIGKRVDECLHG